MRRTYDSYETKAKSIRSENGEGFDRRRFLFTACYGIYYLVTAITGLELPHMVTLHGKEPVDVEYLAPRPHV